MNNSELTARFLSGMEIKCVEPEKRMCAGRFGWVVHRFPIKGGKTTGETLWRDMIESQRKRIGFGRRMINAMKENNQWPILPSQPTKAT